MALIYLPDELVAEVFIIGIDKGLFVKQAVREKLDRIKD